MKSLRAAAFSFLLTAVMASPAAAGFHLIYIVEVFHGTPASPNAQYVVLQAYSVGQKFLNGHRVIVYDANGIEIGGATFTGDLANDADQAKILIATTQAQNFFAVTPDLIMPAIIPAAGGKVCFDVIDCVAWGGYVGPAGTSGLAVGTPFNIPVGLLRGKAIKRRLDIAGSPTVLDFGDDTGDSANDFLFATPAPKNNANQNGAIPPSTCGNSNVQGIETCDDGNTTAGDGCSATCEWEPNAIQPQSIAVDPAAGAGHNGNGVFEPGETLPFLPSWTNTGTSSIALTGTASLFGGPAGPTYVVADGVADYGTIPASATGTCLSAPESCYSVIASGARPATHWDSSVFEVLSNGLAKQWTLHLGQSFSDVPTSYLFYRFVETILHKGVTAGCTATTYCPDASVNRAQMAIFLLKASLGSTYVPPAATGTIFEDVQTTTFGADWIEDLYNRGVTGGCSASPPLYCPGASVTRAQMAVFLLRTKFGSSHVPPAATGIFEDVPPETFFAPFIEELFALGVTGGCSASPPLYCPSSPNTRGQMAVFLTRTFNLQLYAP